MQYVKQFGRVTSFYKIPYRKNVSIKIPLLPWMAGAKYDLKEKSGILDLCLHMTILKMIL